MARKILLADDSVTAQNMGRKILADAGYEVIAVNNGSAALKKIAELKPDLVILDVYMPGYSGLEVCQRLKESPESARIPVLLTVGKLEPFKPEEAQRVRAEGYIVKPFEASELLSALSKLEDKVVPRAEPTKPGRFARAMAAADESDRDSRNENSSGQTGWKSRIAFPQKNKQAEESFGDEPSSYSPNRDLRTVLENGEEQAAGKENEKSEKKEKRRRKTDAAEPSVDLAAFAPKGLPKEVTPEEVAAMTAAAAQMQIAGSAGKNEAPEVRSSGTPISEAAETTTQPQASEHALVKVEATPQVPVVQTESAAAAEVTVSNVHESGDDNGSKRNDDVPMTMAAAAESVASGVPTSSGESRWTAVSVGLGSEEAAISLDQEMREAYASFAHSETESSSTGPLSADQSTPAAAPSAVVAGETSLSNPEPEPAALHENESVPVAQVEPAAEVSSVPAVLSAESQDTEKDTEKHIEKTALVEASGQSFSPGEPRELHQEHSPIAESSSAIQPAEAAANQVEGRLDSEAVKSTAEAWATWRQSRDTSKDGEGTPDQPREFEVSESAPQASAPEETSARAVAAGAEQILQEVSTRPTNGNPSDVASIVDSVLADLRPKLMEEISRKMAEKK